MPGCGVCVGFGGGRRGGWGGGGVAPCPPALPYSAGPQPLPQVRLIGGRHDGRQPGQALNGGSARDAFARVARQHSGRVEARDWRGARPLPAPRRPRQVLRQLIPVLNGHAPALPKVGLHRVRRVAQQGHPPGRPVEQGAAVEDVAAQDVGLGGGPDEVGHLVGPVPKYGQQAGLAAAGRVVATGRLLVEAVPLARGGQGVPWTGGQRGACPGGGR